mmetsp:Transcript_28285/g.76391  ORF Transcript_28285/g.76391 Transcript_28285/m.76391 type:complete len:244 (-) Transcript_28285:92-823(-)
MLRQKVADLAALASHKVDQACWQACLVEQLHHVDSCNGPLCGWLEHHSVASHQCWGDLADSQVDRVVEGRDAQHYAQGHLSHHAQLVAGVAWEGIRGQELALPKGTHTLLCCVCYEVCGAHHLGQSILAWLGNLLDHTVSDGLRMLPHELCHSMQCLSALAKRCACPCLLCFCGSSKNLVHLILRACLHGVGSLVCAWVLVVHGPAAGTLNPLAVEVILVSPTGAPNSVIEVATAVHACAAAA